MSSAFNNITEFSPGHGVEIMRLGNHGFVGVMFVTKRLLVHAGTACSARGNGNRQYSGLHVSGNSIKPFCKPETILLTELVPEFFTCFFRGIQAVPNIHALFLKWLNATSPSNPAFL
jgi:hypothetical protein